MSKKELTTEQIEYLFQFMRRKYVRYYDVQIELVDHFASAIEAMWEKDPNLSFEKAIEKIYAEFPITGFNNLINEKTQAVTQRITKHTWREVKAYLTIPKISITLLLVAVCNIFYSHIPYPVMVGFIMIEIICWTSFFATYFLTRPKNKQKTKFLTLDAIGASQVGFTLIGYIPLYTGPLETSLLGSLLFSSLTVAAILIGYGHFKVANTVFQEWKQQFPEFV